MVTTEAINGENNVFVTQERLEHHWGMDTTAATQLSQGVTEDGRLDIQKLAAGVESMPEAVAKRDQNREEMTKVFRGESDKQVFVVGPCSLDAETNYTELFDYMEELQADNPDAIVVFRGNGSKPRSKGGWGGMFRGSDPADQESLISVYQQAFDRGIAIMTEVTEKDEFLTLAPYLSAVWIGARDMQSTSLHATLSASNIPAAVKNSQDGNPASVENTIQAIGKSTHGDGTDQDKGNEGSGVNLGILAYTYKSNNVGLPTMVEVGEGNQNVAIIARGYGLPEKMGKKARQKAAIKHVGELCTLGAKLDRAVLLDGQHDVPPMFDIDKKQGDRFLQVMRIVLREARKGRIKNAHMLSGFVAELGTNRGRTDVNLLVEEARQEGGLDTVVKESINVRHELLAGQSA